MVRKDYCKKCRTYNGRHKIWCRKYTNKMNEIITETDKNSMLYWFPLIKDLKVNIPETIIIEVKTFLGDEPLSNLKNYLPKIYEKAKILGFPLFIRSDYYSGKHSWKNTCFVENEKSLERQIRNIYIDGLCVDIIGLPFDAVILRKYIEMDSKFTAFYEGMPVSSERRYFINNGKIICHHPYWVEDCIKKPSIKNWKKILKELNKETDEEIKLLSSYTKLIANKLNGYWSVDFCRDKTGKWWFIDCATGERSYHPECDKIIK